MAAPTNKIQGIVPGQTATFTVSPLNKTQNPVPLPLTGVPVWTSSDPTNAPIQPSADGLSATVTIAPDFEPGQGTHFSLTVTMPDGSASTSFDVPYDSGVPPVDNSVSAFVLTQGF